LYYNILCGLALAVGDGNAKEYRDYSRDSGDKEDKRKNNHFGM
jgi:hypothetical protein